MICSSYEFAKQFKLIIKIKPMRRYYFSDNSCDYISPRMLEMGGMEAVEGVLPDNFIHCYMGLDV